MNELLTVPIVLSTISNEYSDSYMLCNEKLMKYSVSLVMEIDELIHKGYTKEEIIMLIKESDFSAIDPELTKEESEYLKNSSIRILNIRYRYFMEEKNNQEIQSSTKKLNKKR